MSVQRLFALAALGFGIALLPDDDAYGASRMSCSVGEPPAVVISTDGTATLTAGATTLALTPGDVLCPGDRISTGDASGIDIRFDGKDSVTSILSNSTVVIPAATDEADVELQSGLMRFLSSVRSVFRIRTPQTDAGIDGTEAMLAVAGPARNTLVLVREGIVTTTDRRDRSRQLALAANEASFSSDRTALERATEANVPQAFRGYLARPEAAADWAIYYPPILLATGSTAPDVRRAARLLDAGEPDRAEALLASYRGSDQAAALALRSLAAVFRNRPDEGLTLARQAVAANPALGAAHVAESYALQAIGMVDKALASAVRGAASAPGDAYALARKAELQLTIGLQTDARETAAASLALQETSLAHAILGFAMLSQRRPSDAIAAFQQAIATDSEAPLPRLGLGLALINSGDEEAGRREIETAAALDPQRAQTRGWLGRAYLQEGRGEKALAQFKLAQEQDPEDPTAWLFEATERYRANQPVAALQALDIAADKSDGRSTLRGRAGLAEDVAVRATATGRVFDVLGFSQQAVQQGAQAVTADPTSAVAHQFLADTYRTKPGFEIAQTSERLKAQLLGHTTSTPLQVSLGESDLALLSTPGTARVTFHEFGSVFDSNGFRAIASGGVGTQGRFEDEVSLALADDGFSLKVGQYHAQTDRFRFNDGVQHDVLALEGKAEVTPWLTLTAEGRIRETVQGEPFLGAFPPASTPEVETESRRAQFTVGGHARLNRSNDLLFYGVVARTDETETTRNPGAGFLPATLDTAPSRTNSMGAEVQNIHSFDFEGFDGTLTFGAGAQRSSSSGTFGRALLGIPAPPFLTFQTAESDHHWFGYAYLDVELFDGFELTAGASLERAESSETVPTGFASAQVQQSKTQINPKFGVRYEPVDGFVLRGAYARTLKRDFVQDRTLEPTTIAGFNQFFDDTNLTDANMFAGGADFQILDNLWIGGEYVHRDLSVPNIVTFATFNPPFPPVLTPALVRVSGEERTARAYLNATLGDAWAFSTGAEWLDNRSNLAGRPDQVETLMVPVRARYFHPSGFFAGAEAIWFQQDALDLTGGFANGLTTIENEGVVLNASFGYRFPNSRGVASIELNNILDENFSLENSSNNSARPSSRPLAEGFSAMARVTIGF